MDCIVDFIEYFIGYELSTNLIYFYNIPVLCKIPFHILDS